MRIEICGRIPAVIVGGLLAMIFELVPSIETPQAAPGAETTLAPEAYDFTLTTIDGKTVRFSDYKGKVILLNFWETWCPPCVQETPALVRLYEKYKSRGFVVIGVTESSEEAKVKSFIDRFNIPYVIGRDETREISRHYQVYALPTSFLFSRDGKRQRKIEGGYGEQIETMLDPVVQALLDSPATPQEARKTEKAPAKNSLTEAPSHDSQTSSTVALAPPKDQQPPPEPAREQPSIIFSAYSRWNLAVPLFALIGLFMLSRLRFNPRRTGTADEDSLPAPSSPSSTTTIGQPQIVPRVRLVRLSPIETAPGEIVLTQDDILIGRGQECDVVIAHPSVSRAHARVRLSKQGYILFDLKSKTGTYINDRRIEENLLRKGLVVRIGDVEYYCHESALQSL